MKKIFLFLFLILFSVSCDIEFGDGSDDTVALVWMSKISNWYNDCDLEYLYFSMPIMGSSIPTVNSIEINDIVLSEDNLEHYFDYDSTIYYNLCDGIGMYTQNLTEGHNFINGIVYHEFPNLNQVSFDLETNLSSLSGSIDYPDSITNASYAFSSDSSSIIINWLGNADYYEIDFIYECYENGEWNYNSNYNLYSQSTSYELEFNCDPNEYFYIYEADIVPINGPMPEEGALPNMMGGNGYLYYSGPTYYLDDYYYNLSDKDKQKRMAKDSDESMQKVLEILNID